MSDHIYAQSEIFAVVRQLLKSIMRKVQFCSALMQGRKRMRPLILI